MISTEVKRNACPWQPLTRNVSVHPVVGLHPRIRCVELDKDAFMLLLVPLTDRVSLSEHLYPHIILSWCAGHGQGHNTLAIVSFPETESK